MGQPGLTGNFKGYEVIAFINWHLCLKKSARKNTLVHILIKNQNLVLLRRNLLDLKF